MPKINIKNFGRQVDDSLIEWAMKSNYQAFDRVIVEEKQITNTILDVIISKAELDGNFIESLMIDKDYLMDQNDDGYDEICVTKSPSRRASAMSIDKDECSDYIPSQERNLCEDYKFPEKYKRDMFAFVWKGKNKNKRKDIE